MKVRFLTWYNTLLTSLIGLLGFSACDALEPKDEYGAPYVKFTVKGRVTDANGQPLEGIQAEVGERYNEHFARAAAPAATDADGRLSISADAISADNLALVLTDTDGTAGGGYFGTDTIALSDLTHKKTEEGKNWYGGAYEYTADITMHQHDTNGK